MAFSCFLLSLITLVFLVSYLYGDSLPYQSCLWLDCPNLRWSSLGEVTSLLGPEIHGGKHEPFSRIDVRERNLSDYQEHNPKDGKTYG